MEENEDMRMGDDTSRHIPKPQAAILHVERRGEAQAPGTTRCH